MKWLVVVFVVGCSSNHAAAPDAGGDDDDTAVDAPVACPREAAPADRVRRIVISHPFLAAGGNANNWDVLDLSATGDISKPGRPFVMGNAAEGVVQFTADGTIGMVPQSDGTLGVFSLADDGTPTVVAAAFKGGFYASQLVMAGDHALVLDGDTLANGGGIYRVDIACDGTPIDRGMVVAASLPNAFAFVPGTDRAVIAATQLGASAAGSDAELVTWGDAPTLLGASDAFGDDMAIVGGATLTADGGHFLIGDRSEFSGIPNRVAIVQVDAGALVEPQVIPSIDDPFSLVASPFGDVVLVVDGYGNAMFVLEGGATGFTLRGEVTYSGAKPELPGGAVRIDAGMLKGWVFVEENSGVRTVEMKADGSVVDHGRFLVGANTEDVVGAIGVTP